jgi:hypothetical protein
MTQDKYLQVRIFKSGVIKVVKCPKDFVDYTGGDLYNLYNGNRKKPISYNYFITTEKRYEKDCKKHFDKMLRDIRKEYNILDKKKYLILKQQENVNC